MRGWSNEQVAGITPEQCWKSPPHGVQVGIIPLTFVSVTSITAVPWGAISVRSA